MPPGTGMVFKLVVEESDSEKFERRRAVEARVCILSKDTRPEARKLFEELPLHCNFYGVKHSMRRHVLAQNSLMNTYVSS